jgi:hypothetical protein
MYYKNLCDYYGDNVQTWEIVNEPDFTGNVDQNQWLLRPPYPIECSNLWAPFYHYIRQMRIAWEVTKKFRPNTFVAPGGVGSWQFVDAMCRYTDNPVDGSVTPDYPKTGGAYFDCLSYHDYPYFAAKDWNGTGFTFNYHSDRAKYNMQTFITGMTKTLTARGFDGIKHPKKHLLLTEINVPRHPVNNGNVYGSDDYQKNFQVKNLVQCQKLGVQQMTLFTTGEHQSEYLYQLTGTTNEYNFTGLYYRLDDYTPGNEVMNPAGVAWKTYSTIIGSGFTYDAVTTSGMTMPATVDGAAFKDASNQYCYILWAVTHIDKDETASATYSFPDSFGYSTMDRYEWNYGVTGEVNTVPAQGIALNGTPTFFKVGTPGITVTPTATLTPTPSLSF